MRFKQILAVIVAILSQYGHLRAQVGPDERARKFGDEVEIVDRPLYEIGFNFITAKTPDYPGADQSNVYYIPAPKFLYRGRVVKNDRRGGLRSSILDTDRFELSLSVGGALPVNSENNQARAGMSDLGLILQVGPRGRYYLFKDRRNLLVLDVAARPSFAVGKRFRDWRGLGFVIVPQVYYRHLWNKFNFLTSIQFKMATYEFHKYIYEVENFEALSNRPSYHPRSGYLSTDLTLAVSFRMSSRLRVFFGWQGSFLEQNVNRESPLFKKTFNTGGAIGLTYILHQSEKTVQVRKF